VHLLPCLNFNEKISHFVPLVFLLKMHFFSPLVVHLRPDFVLGFSSCTWISQLGFRFCSSVCSPLPPPGKCHRRPRSIFSRSCLRLSFRVRRRSHLPASLVLRLRVPVGVQLPLDFSFLYFRSAGARAFADFIFTFSIVSRSGPGPGLAS
jgi:hypothetical protein